MQRALVAFALLSSAVLAGCINGKAPTLTDDGVTLPYYLEDVFPVDLDHDHTDPGLHAVAHNMNLTAYHSCTAEGTIDAAVGGYTDIAFFENYAFVGTSRGFCILDVTDPEEPMFVSAFAGEPASDLEVSADGNHVFLPTQRNSATSLNGPGGATSNLPRGVTVVNVADKERPVFESYYPVPTNGVHTLTPYLMGDRQLVFIQSYDWFPPQGIWPNEAGVVPVPQQNPAPTQRIEITELTELPDGTMALELVSRWSLPRPTTDPGALWFPHDSAVQKHPLTDQVLLYVAYWDAGLVIVDVSDPSMPVLVSQYNDLAPSIYNAYHDVKVFDELIDGRHITVAGPELGQSTEAGHVRIFDTSDPTKPVQLGTWRLPENPGTPGGYLYSPHVFTLAEGRIYIGHNHGGVWVIDVSNETLLRAPASAGFHFPRGDELNQQWSERSSTWGAYWHRGHVYATEGSSGVHVLKFAGDKTLGLTIVATTMPPDA